MLKGVRCGVWQALVVCMVASTIAVAADPPPVETRPGVAVTPPVEEDYVLHCSACHRSSGVGVPGVVPGLQDVGKLFARNGGRAYLVQVPGVAQAPLSDARIARLLDWVLITFGGATAAANYTADEVNLLRQAPLRDPGARREALLANSKTRDPIR